MPEIQRFFIGGCVAIEDTGKLMKMLYEAGATNMQCDPVYAGITDRTVNQVLAKPKLRGPYEASEPRTKVLEALRALGAPATAPKVAAHLRKSVHATGFHLRKLVEAGLATQPKRGLYSIKE